MTRKAISTRERWLLTLLPASLVLVGSFILPSGKAERRQLNAVLSTAPSDEELHREVAQLSKTIGESRSEVAQIEAELASLRAPDASDPAASVAASPAMSMAGRFETLGGRLDEAGIAVVSSEAVRRPGSAADETPANSWKLTVASTWPQLTEAIAQRDLVPPGLVVDSIEMDAPRPGTRLRRWVIMLSANDGAQRS